MQNLGISRLLGGVRVLGGKEALVQEAGRVAPPPVAPAGLVCISEHTYVLSRGSTTSLFHFYELPCKSLIKGLELESHLLS